KGESVTLAGWVHRRRDHGGLIFIDLRDHDGLTQVVFNPKDAAEAYAVADTVRGEYVLQVEGTVAHRPEGTENPNLSTGEIEVKAHAATILNESKTPPFYIVEEVDVDELLRLKYRYLDLRREGMHRNIVFRARVVKFIRDWLTERGFTEIETPILTAPTPEGARDYVVPSRVHPGRFYALPQSPQQMKQLLMVAGFERYFQIAHCLRDEDLRADRQPEHTQLDLEASFVTSDDVYTVVEAAVVALWDEAGESVPAPFPRMSFAAAMERYGTDKPDLRFGYTIEDLSDFVRGRGFRAFDAALSEGGRVRGIRVAEGAKLSRKQIDELTDDAKKAGAGGLAML
ncbi:hypothetical protein LCGC14_3123980, partial [marine sediment metagenome]